MSPRQLGSLKRFDALRKATMISPDAPTPPNPNRLQQLSPAVSGPAAGAVMPQWLARVLVAVVGAAGVCTMLPGLPPLVTQICGAVVAAGAALGIMSPGVRKV